MTNNNSIKKITKYPQTGNRRFQILKGVAVSLILIATPFLFYIYKYAPSDATKWETLFGTIESGGFYSVQIYMHALFTKLTFVLLTGIWFLTSQNWWKYAILVPFTMFLFQLSGVINDKLSYIDEFDFWYSLPVVLPIVFFMIYLSLILSKKITSTVNLKDDVDKELKNIFSDEL